MSFLIRTLPVRGVVGAALCALLAACATHQAEPVKVATTLPAMPVAPAPSPMVAQVPKSVSAVQIQRRAVLAPGQEGAPKPAFAWKTLPDLIGGEKAQLLTAFVTADVNTLEAANPQLLQRLKNKWEGAAQGRFTVLHFGDSHVQGGYGAQISRHKLQSLAGSAGRGMVFPYAIAKTYSQNDYKSSFEGEWITANSIQVYPKLPLGVSGFVARTASAEASFTLQFNQQFESGPKVLKFMYRTSSAAYRLRMQSGDLLWESELQSDDGSQGNSRMVEIAVPQLSDTIRFDVVNADPKPEDTFELHGVSIENKTPGVIYHNLGVGGAAYGSLRSQAYFEAQSSLLAPDLVILDWGTNDLIYKNTVPEQLEATMVETIRKVRAEHPDALILLTSVQDTYFRKQPITAAWDFAQLVRRLAKENDCLFYDWYRVAGGEDAMRTWYAYGLALPDHVHLSGTGYAIKGDLLAQAMLNAVAWRMKYPEKTSLWMDAQKAEVPRSVSAWLKALQPFQRRPDLIRVSAPAKAKATTAGGKSAARSGAKEPQAKSRTATKSTAKSKSVKPKKAH